MSIHSNIIFLYADSLRRDFSTCYIIEQELQALGYKTFICSRRNLLKVMRFVLPAKLFIIGQINMFTSPAFVQAVRKAQGEIIFMPAEGFAANEEYDVMYPKDVDYSLINALLFWGENSKQWFVDNRTIDDQAKLIRAGYARLPIAKEYASLTRKNAKKIGFVGRFPAINDLYGRSIMEFFLIEPTLRGRSQLAGRLNSESEAMQCYLDLFDFVINETDYSISFRPHPNEDTSTYQVLIDRYQGRIEINDVYDVAEWMSECSAIIGLASSSFIDAHLAGTPVICLDKLLGSQASTLHFDPALVWMYESCHLPDNLDQAKALLTDDSLEPVASDVFIKLIDDDFRGDTDIVFDRVLAEISKKPLNAKATDVILLPLLKAADFLLASLQYLRGNKSLQFDYSYFYHSVSASLKSVSAGIRGKLKKLSA